MFSSLVKVVSLLFLVSSLSLAANSQSTPITPTQIQQVEANAGQLLQDITLLKEYADYVNNNMNANFNLFIFGSTTTYVMPAQMESDLLNINTYNTLKQNIQNDLGNMP